MTEVQLEPTDKEQRIGTATTFTPEQVAVIKNTVAKGTTNTELAYFLMQAKSVGLNPLNKEIWCYKDNRGNVLIFTGRDGFLAKAQRDPRFNGMRSASVRENDEFSIDVANGKVNHVFGGSNEKRGKPVGAYAIVFLKDPNTGTAMEPTIFWADFKTYEKGSAWKSHPDAMIQKVAEANALKRALGMSGIEVDENFFIKNGVATATLPVEEVDAEVVDDELEKVMEQVRTLLDSYEGEDVDELRQMCAEKLDAGEFTVEFGKNIIEQIQEG